MKRIWARGARDAISRATSKPPMRGIARSVSTSRMSSPRARITSRAAAPSDGDRQHQIVLHAPGEHRADDDPDGPWQVAHLHRQHRADQRPCACDRREVMPEQHSPVGRHVVGGVLEKLSRGGIVVTRADDLHLEQPGIEPEGDHIGADRGDHEPHRVHRLPAEERDDRPRDGAQ